MIELSRKDYSWILIPSNPGVESFIYSRGWTSYSIKFLNESGLLDDWILSFTLNDNNSLRKDSIHLMEHFGVDKIFLKYKEEFDPKILENNGNELECSIKKWGESNYNWTFNGQSFSISLSHRWIKPNKMEDFKVGSIVECLSSGKWIRRKVEDPKKEWEDIYKLMVQWNKVRILSS